MSQYYMAFDGGGTKLQGILFDQDCRLISAARSGGINRNVHDMESVREHIKECVDGLFEKADRPVDEIGKIYSSWGESFGAAIQMHCPHGPVIRVGEGCLGALSCGVTDGVCALSGTGSDVFYIRDAEEKDAIGGWGYLFGDDGSGVWIGKQAARTMMRYLEGIDEGTLLHKMLQEETGSKTPNDMSHTVYSAKSPPYKLGTFCKIVNLAAEAGDRIAIEIMESAGNVLAESTREMLMKHLIEDSVNICTTGGVFQNCRIMREAFDRKVNCLVPGSRVFHAIFEPVVGCVIYHMVHSGIPLDEKAVEFLKEEYRDYCVE